MKCIGHFFVWSITWNCCLSSPTVTHHSSWTIVGSNHRSSHDTGVRANEYESQILAPRTTLRCPPPLGTRQHAIDILNETSLNAVHPGLTSTSTFCITDLCTRGNFKNVIKSRVQGQLISGRGRSGGSSYKDTVKSRTFTKCVHWGKECHASPSYKINHWADSYPIYSPYLLLSDIWQYSINNKVEET